MPRFSLLLLTLALLTPNSVHAARIYNIVDYPDLQNGHSLNGTITTTDDAPKDGLLVAEEILDWEWEISGANNLSVVRNSDSSTRVSSIHISNEQIILPLESDAHLRFFPLNPGVQVWHLTWSANTVASGLPSTYRTGFAFRDSFVPYWESNLPSGSNTNWAIATIVPEASSLISAFLALITVLTLYRGCSKVS